MSGELDSQACCVSPALGIKVPLVRETRKSPPCGPIGLCTFTECARQRGTPWSWGVWEASEDPGPELHAGVAGEWGEQSQRGKGQIWKDLACRL